MPVEINIHENTFLEGIWQKALHEGEDRGLERGREEGLKRGLEKGLEKGREEVAREFLGPIPDPEILRWLEAGNLEQLRSWSSRAWSAATIADVCDR